MDDGHKMDAWLKVMKRRNAFDELVAFFHDSFVVVMGHVGEFFGLHQQIYYSCGVSVDQMSTMSSPALRFCLSFLVVVAAAALVLPEEVGPHS